jgi:16S rRNA (guanine527-N7)-methyltransferase
VQSAELRRAAAGLDVPLDESRAEKLIHYVALLEHWNASFNLISRKDIGRIWPRHILDSLSIAPYLRTPSVRASTGEPGLRAIDIGTGAGLPGIVLAIGDPDVRWLLIDRNQRKIRFLETVIAALELQNVTARVLDLGNRPPSELVGQAEFVVSRAVDDPAVLVPLAAPLLGPAGRMILMTGAAGPAPDSDKSPQVGGFRICAVHDLVIPGLDRTHEVTIMERAQHRSDGIEIR